jgi:hypothetical protein
LIVIDANSKEVIAIFQGKGSEHDFSIYKRSGIKLHEMLILLADSGFQGIEDLHPASWIPKKRSKKHPLTKEDKRVNKALSRVRIRIEHVNRRLKRFRIFSCRYRNKRLRHGLRMSLLCGIYNFEIS